MSKLKIEKGASRIRRVPLKTTIDGTVADEIEQMCQWSENDTSYVVNQLLRFALNQSEDFQQYKQSLENSGPAVTGKKISVPSTSVCKVTTQPAHSTEAER
jgi:hypothetical protein